ncbi:MAG: hypothetical protein NTY76_06315 [Candidatus Omnitrophica bacterium]|nr:hypothetical protein [Candidatus Omnitrophota bacterium]
MGNIKIYRRLAKSLAQLVSLTKMYNARHPIVKEKAEMVYKEMSDFFANNKQSIVLAKSVDMLLINSEKVEPESRLMAKFIEDFIGLEVGSIEIEPALSAEELDAFLHIICRTEHIVGVDKIKQFLSEKKVPHLIVRAATFKLVQENEDIVKRGEFVKVEELRPDVTERFLKDFTDGKVSEKLASADKDYKIVAHNSTFLAGMTYDLLKTTDEPEDLEKIIWLLADYLIDEIGTSKEEEMNRQVLGEIEKKLLSLWQDKPEKKRLAGGMEKTCTVISAALQIKGLLTRYKRHKKAIESTAGKIKKIMHSLPVDSQLYRKTAANIREIGPVVINESIFK